MKKNVYVAMFSADGELVKLGERTNCKDAIRETRHKFHQHPKSKFGGWWSVRTTDGKYVAYGGRQYTINGRGLNYRYSEKELNDRYKRELKETMNINTLDMLANYINSCDEWRLHTYRIIERNGWRDDTGSTYGVCTDEQIGRTVYLDDNGFAKILP